MAGLLNTIYLVLATVVAVGGLALVAKAMNDADPDGPSLADWSLMLVAIIFVIGLAVGLMT